MRYTLWSHGRLVGHTDLDVHTVTSTMRQGFVQPTPEGREVLVDATGVWRTMAEIKRASRARGRARTVGDSDLFMAAVDRRERLQLELRDESGAPFECDYIRITDLFDMENGIVEEMCDTEEEMQADFEVRLSSLSPEERERALAERAKSDAEIEEFVSEMLADREEQNLFGAGWPPPPPEDPRWSTMQYLLQATLKSPEYEEFEEMFGDGPATS